MKIRYNLCPDVRVYEVFGDLKTFTEDINLSIAPDEPNERDITIRDKADIRQHAVRSYGYRCKSLGLLHLKRGFPFEATVSMMLVMEPLEIPALLF